VGGLIENITVLFTDLVGSTEIASALTPEAADALRRRHFSSLRQAIASCRGTEVKSTGDGLMVVFRAASSALACAVAMQQAVERDNARAEPPLGLRIGLSTGEATQDSGDYYGDAVIEAARLCSVAQAGQILVADLVRANAGRRSHHSFTSLGEFELKGLSVPVETLELRWEALSDEVDPAGHIPLPSRLAHRPAVGLIGRDHELALLASAAKRVGTGSGSEVVLVAGEPGEGKSTLVSELARDAHESGASVLLGRCDEDVDCPYGPFREAFGHLVTHADEGLLRFHVSEHGGVLGRLVPALGQRLVDLPTLPTSDSDAERYLLFAAAVGLLDLLCADRPVALILEDLHWADAPSVQLLRYLVSSSRSSRMLLLGTYRDAELSSTHPLTDALAILRREQNVSFLALRGLDDTGVASFMESAAGHDLDDRGMALAQAVYRETDGNPFFVTEVLRHLSDTGAIVQDRSGRWSPAHSPDEIALPQSVRQVIGARVARVGETAIKALSTAAVIGREFDLDLLAVATGIEEDDLLEVLDQAHGASLAREVPGVAGRYAFRHALIQHTLYEDLGPTRRTRLHRRVGDALEQLCGQGTRDRAGELARHYVLATRPTDVRKAVLYSQQAGEMALAALAPEDALRHFEQAFDLVEQSPLDDPTIRIDILTDLGIAQLQSGKPEFRETLLRSAREARRLNDADRLIAAALANNRGFHSDLGAIDAERVELLEASLDASPVADSPQRSRLLATLCCELTFGPLERRIELAGEAKAMARRLGDRETLAWVCNLCGVPLRIPSLLEAQFADAREAMAMAEELGDPISLFWVANQLVIEGTRAGEFQLATECLATMKMIAEKLRQPMLVWTAKFSEAGQALLRGDPVRSEQLATEAFEVGSASGQPDAFSNFGTQLMGIRAIQGRTGELVQLVEDLVKRHPDVPTFRSVLASCYLDAGDDDEAGRLLEQASADGFQLPMDTTWLDGVVVNARIAIELRHVGAALQLLPLLAPYSDQVPYQGLTANPPVATFLGGLAAVAGRHEEAEANLEKGAALSSRGGMRYGGTYTDLLRGRMLLDLGSDKLAERARATLEQSRSEAASNNYVLLERRATAELARMA
jgi:class 3 adenylate cyclase